MGGMIRTDDATFKALDEELGSANTSLSEDESARNAKGSKLKQTTGFGCLPRISVSPTQLAKVSTGKSVNLLNTERERIKYIHENFKKTQNVP